MAISVYRWTDGPYLAFTDDNDRRYVLERGRAALLLDRLRAHLAQEPNRDLVVHRRFIRDPERDLCVIDLYLQDCDDLIEVITPTSPILLISLVESCTLLRLAPVNAPALRPCMERDLPGFLQESVLTILLAGFRWIARRLLGLISALRSTVVCPNRRNGTTACGLSTLARSNTPPPWSV
jgi:hypothetical protein